MMTSWGDVEEFLMLIDLEEFVPLPRVVDCDSCSFLFQNLSPDVKSFRVRRQNSITVMDILWGTNW